MAIVSEFFTVIVPEVGYKEKRSNAQLDNHTANAGSGNWVDVPLTYNGHTYKVYGQSKWF